MIRVPHSTIDSFHSILMDDDQFNEAAMRVALQVATDTLEAQRLNDPQSGAYDDEDMYDLAMELVTLISVG